MLKRRSRCPLRCACGSDHGLELRGGDAGRTDTQFLRCCNAIGHESLGEAGDGVGKAGKLLVEGLDGCHDGAEEAVEVAVRPDWSVGLIVVGHLFDQMNDRAPKA